MEAMEVDLPGVLPGAGGGGTRRSRRRAINMAAGLAGSAAAPQDVSDSSDTEVDEDGEGEWTAPRSPPRLPATWAFSQRAAGAPSAAQGAWLRRRLR